MSQYRRANPDKISTRTEYGLKQSLKVKRNNQSVVSIAVVAEVWTAVLVSVRALKIWSDDGAEQTMIQGLIPCRYHELSKPSTVCLTQRICSRKHSLLSPKTLDNRHPPRKALREWALYSFSAWSSEGNLKMMSKIKGIRRFRVWIHLLWTKVWVSKKTSTSNQ